MQDRANPEHTVAQDFSFSFDKVHYSMPRKYLRKQLEVRASDDLLYVYNLNGDLVRTHRRSHTPKDWVVILEDMPKEYSTDELGMQLCE